MAAWDRLTLKLLTDRMFALECFSRHAVRHGRRFVYTIVDEPEPLTVVPESSGSLCVDKR